MFDVFIIGGGPGGYKCAELLGKQGMKVALAEENDVGGICLNQGCIPFKSYLHVSGIRQHAIKLGTNGLINIPTAEMNQDKIHNYKNNIVKNLKQNVDGLLRNCGVTIFHSHAEVVAEQSGSILIDAGGENVETAMLVIATGSKAKTLQVPDNLPYQVIDSKSMLELDRLPDKIDIIGAGAIGLETASFFADAGCKVAVMEFLDHIGGHIDLEISRSMQGILERKGIEFFTDTALLAFDHDGVKYKRGREEFVRHTDMVFMAIGRIPLIDMESLNRIKVGYDKKGIIIDEQCRTSNPKVFACGDVTGKLMLAHTAYGQAKVIADTILGRKNSMRYDIIPRVIYSNPEEISVGLSEEDCMTIGSAYAAKSLPMTYSGKYFAENGKDGAKAKMIVDSENKIVGFHMIGNGASELSLAAELMLLHQMKADEIGNIIFPHPTYGEIIGDLAALFDSK